MEQTITEAAVTPQGGKRLAGGGKKIPLIILGAVLAAVLAVYLGLCGWAASLDTFYPNTSLNGVKIGGLTVFQAAERMAQELPQKTLEFYLPLADETGDGISAPEGEVLYEQAPAATVTYAELGLTQTLDYTAGAEFALRVGQKSHGFFSAGWDYLAHLFGWRGSAAVPLEPEDAVFQSRLAALASQFSRAPQDTSFEIGENEILLTKYRSGLAVSADALKEPVLAAISTSECESLLVDAAVLPARALSAQAIYDEVSGEMKNAGYDPVTDTITPERPGAEFDAAAAQAALDGAQPGQTVSVPAQIQLPRVTAERLRGVLFRDVLGSATTKVGGTAARISNVRLASSAFSGTVLNCGDIFSYNGTVGQRTTARGYQAAPAYVKGETVDEIGGGVCQPSSTLYLACLKSNLEITERYAHRYAPTYIEWGMDATVSWGGPDYRFTNNTDYPIKLVATYAKGYLTVKILGTKVDDIQVKMTKEVLSDTPYETVYEEDATLAPGTESVKTTPYTGHKVKTYRNLYDGSGTLISSQFEASSDYKSRNKVILRGPALPAAEEPAAPASSILPLPQATPEPPAAATPETPASPEQTPVIVVVPEEPAA